MDRILLQKNRDFVSGEITLPTSKSLSNRALIIKALCKDPFVIHQISNADDTIGLQKLLASPRAEFDVGAAGTSMRFLVSLLSITPGTHLLTGNERMQQRPVGKLVECLKSIGAEIQYTSGVGYPPLRISGKKLSGGIVNIDGSISSQFISSLLMIAPYLEKGLEINIQGKMVSGTYIEMTLGLMNEFGIEYQKNGPSIFIPPQNYVARDYTVEADWSAAAFWYGLIANADPGTTLLFKNLSMKSLQGDKKTAEYFQSFGVDIYQTEKGLMIKKTNPGADNLIFDLVNEPDLFPPLAFTAATARLKVSFTGLDTLNLKESNRIEAVKTELEKTGAVCTSGESFFNIENYQSVPSEISFDTYNDHRLAMSAAIFSQFGAAVSIVEPGVASKSYPDFWKDLKKIRIVNIY
jgi:3-phosphoshikimate 1-carboxyvinyltransferase